VPTLNGVGDAAALSRPVEGNVGLQVNIAQRQAPAGAEAAFVGDGERIVLAHEIDARPRRG
jgi:hypothetical protein